MFTWWHVSYLWIGGFAISMISQYSKRKGAFRSHRDVITHNWQTFLLYAICGPYTALWCIGVRLNLIRPTNAVM